MAKSAGKNARDAQNWTYRDLDKAYEKRIGKAKKNWNLRDFSDFSRLLQKEKERTGFVTPYYISGDYFKKKGMKSVGWQGPIQQKKKK